MRRHALPLLPILGLACAVAAVENAQTTLSIPGMTSDARVAAVETLLEQAAGVKEYTIRRNAGEARLTYDPNATDPATVAEALLGVRGLPALSPGEPREGPRPARARLSRLRWSGGGEVQ
jgi:copper chaperone CopZ